MYVIEFRSGSYWHHDVEKTGRGVSLEKATRFLVRANAEAEAAQWSLAGALVVPVSEVEENKKAAANSVGYGNKEEFARVNPDSPY